MTTDHPNFWMIVRLDDGRTLEGIFVNQTRGHEAADELGSPVKSRDGQVTRDPVEPFMEAILRHTDPRDVPNIGRVHAASRITDCGLCRCGAHNVEDNPWGCMQCVESITEASDWGMA